jgi:hypothetical protein
LPGFRYVGAQHAVPCLSPALRLLEKKQFQKRLAISGGSRTLNNTCGGQMSNKFSAIKERLAQSYEAVTREDIDWLVKRVEELEKENEYLKTELAYSEYQGEIG